MHSAVNVREATSSPSADMAELHISDIGRCIFHEEGKLMDFDIIVVPQGGMFKCDTLLVQVCRLATLPVPPEESCDCFRLGT